MHYTLFIALWQFIFLDSSALFFRSSRFRRQQRVVENVLVHTREIETADHDNPLLGLDDMMSVKPT
jgi:hypothetical protein